MILGIWDRVSGGPSPVYLTTFEAFIFAALLTLLAVGIAAVVAGIINRSFKP